MSGLGARWWLYGGGARDRRRLQHPVHGRDLRRRRRGVRGSLRGLDHRRGQGLLAPAPRRRRGGVRRLGGQVAVLAHPSRQAVYTMVAVYGTSDLFSFSGWREIFRVMGGDVYGAANIMYVRAHTLRPRPRSLPHARARGHDPGGLRHLGHPLRGEPHHLRGRAGAHHRRALDHQLRGRGGPLLRRIPGLRRGAPSLPGGAGPEDPGRPAVVAGAVVVVLVLLVPRMPFSDETVSPGLIDWTRIGTGGTSRLDVQADVGDYLTAGREAELMRIRELGATVVARRDHGLLRRRQVVGHHAAGGRRRGGDRAGVETRPVLQRVQVLNAQTDLIFGGYKIVGPPSFGRDPELRRLVVDGRALRGGRLLRGALGDTAAHRGAAQGRRHRLPVAPWCRGSSSSPTTPRP